jgi:ABC-type sugar transport system substrate-binding protein
MQKRQHGAAWMRRSCLYVLVVATLSGCERDSDTDHRDRRSIEGARVAMIGAAVADPQWPGIRGGAERYARAVPSVRLATMAPADETSDSLLDVVRTALEEPPVGICLHVRDPAIAAEAIAAIAEKHVVLVTLGTQCDAAGVYGHVDVARAAAAELIGSNLKQLAGDKRSYLLLHDAGRDDRARSAFRRFCSAVEQQRDLAELQAQDASTTRLPEREIVREMLGTFRHAGLIVTLEPGVWIDAPLGWRAALRAENAAFRYVTTSAVPALWADLGTPAAPGIAAGLAGTIDGDLGYIAIRMVTEALASPEGGARYRVVAPELVTPETLPDFARRYAESAGLDVDELLPGTAPATAP